jgi:N-acetylglucosaminyl-diphospho-decaprenol L-rhamnosyltransferase
MGNGKKAGSESPCAMPHALSNLSIVIITRNTKDLLRNLLKSIEADNPLKPFLREVIIIDNFSTDGSNTMVHKEFPGVYLVKNGHNKGFAAAANIGISCAEGDYIFFLNSDTMLIEGEVATMVQFMEENPDVGICGPQLVYEDMRLQRSYAHIPSLLFEIFPRSLLELLFPARYSTKRIPKEEVNSASLLSPNAELRTPPRVGRDVPSLIGAAIVVRRKLLQDFGGFDERFFFFLEETDLCVRAREIGARVVFLPHAKVVHLQGKTVRRQWIKGRMQYNISLYKFIRKHHTVLYYYIFQGIRIVKSFIVPLVLSILPFLLLHRRTRRTYIYYLKLFLWHLRGCPDNAGLLISSPR